ILLRTALLSARCLSGLLALLLQIAARVICVSRLALCAISPLKMGLQGHSLAGAWASPFPSFPIFTAVMASQGHVYSECRGCHSARVAGRGPAHMKEYADTEQDLLRQLMNAQEAE